MHRITVLIIGSGGREHALVWKLAQSKKIEMIYCAPGNPGIGQIAENISIKTSEFDKIISFAKKEKIDITFVGPEIPLIDGIVDLFRKNRLIIIGPTKNAAKLEGSKAYAKKIMKKYRIPTAKYELFKDFKKATQYINKQSVPIVIKASGQAAGKGVLVAKNKKEALKFLSDIMVKKIFGNSGDEVVIEEFLEGPEVSFMVATDGKDSISFLPSQDHKRVFDGDSGPNTGGMGAYAPVPFVDKKLISRIEKEIVKPTLLGMEKEGHPYEGILYPGIILTKTGPKVLEFNCRFGDPETQPLMTLLKTDLLDIFLAISAKGRSSFGRKKLRNIKLRWHKGFAVCVVLTAKGYPGKYEMGEIINDTNIKRGAHVFHSGTQSINRQTKSSGGRVLGVTATGKTLKNAIDYAYKNIGNKGIHFQGMQYRKDIGKKGLKNYE